MTDNLPGYMQYLDLIRDCISAFSLPALPDNVVETAHVFQGTMSQSYAYAEVDNKWQREVVNSEYWCPTTHALSLDNSRKRRKEKVDAKKALSGVHTAASTSLVPNSTAVKSLDDEEDDEDEAEETEEPMLLRTWRKSQSRS